MVGWWGVGCGVEWGVCVRGEEEGEEKTKGEGEVGGWMCGRVEWEVGVWEEGEGVPLLTFPF